MRDCTSVPRHFSVRSRRTQGRAGYHCVPTYTVAYLTSSTRGLRSGAVALTAHYCVNAVKSPPRSAKQACCSCCVVAHYRAFGLHFLSQSVYCGYYCSTDDSTVMPLAGNLISLHCVRKLNNVVIQATVHYMRYMIMSVHAVSFIDHPYFALTPRQATPRVNVKTKRGRK